MALKVEIDRHSGFCGGVIRAISRAERFLEESPGRKLYSLGAIVHNEAELSRLGEKGLVTVTKEDLREMEDPRNETLLIRAHGEPPETYSYVESLGINLIDCTCPVVLKLQQSIRAAYDRLNAVASERSDSGSLRGTPLSPLRVQGDNGSARDYKKARRKAGFFVVPSGIEPLFKV